MSTMVVTTRITHKYLMNKSKWDLAPWIMDDLDKIDKHEARLSAAAALITAQAAAIADMREKLRTWDNLQLDEELHLAQADYDAAK
jgi:hypothetical protein